MSKLKQDLGNHDIQDILTNVHAPKKQKRNCESYHSEKNEISQADLYINGQ